MYYTMLHKMLMILLRPMHVTIHARDPGHIIIRITEQIKIIQ